MRRAKARLRSLTREFNWRDEKTNEKEEREVPCSPRCTLARVCVCSLTAHVHVTRVQDGNRRIQIASDSRRHRGIRE